MEIKNVKDLTEYVLKNSDSSNEEERILSQVRCLYDYVSNNIDYDLSFSDRGYTTDAFFEDKRCVCGPISNVVHQVLDNLDIENDYIWGHMQIGDEVGGHRWNSFKIGDKTYMLDCTLGMVLNRFKEGSYINTPFQKSFTKTFSGREDDVLIGFSKLFPGEVIDEFKVVDGLHTDDSTSKKYTNPEEYFIDKGEELSTLDTYYKSM